MMGGADQWIKVFANWRPDSRPFLMRRAVTWDVLCMFAEVFYEILMYTDVYIYIYTNEYIHVYMIL